MQNLTPLEYNAPTHLGKVFSMDMQQSFSVTEVIHEHVLWNNSIIKKKTFSLHKGMYDHIYMCHRNIQYILLE